MKTVRKRAFQENHARDTWGKSDLKKEMGLGSWERPEEGERTKSPSKNKPHTLV